MLYGSEAYERSALPQSAASASRKYCERGIGRACLLGVLAWADARTGAYRRYAAGLVREAWDSAPIEALTTPELEIALRERGIRWDVPLRAGSASSD